MGKRTKSATIISASLGVASYLLERGLDMAGITLSLGWAIVLWVISGLLILFAGVVGFKSYMWPFLRTIRIVRKAAKETLVQSSVPDFSQKYADWMTAALNRDTNNFPRCMFVHNMTINWQPLRETDSYFLVHYDVYSSSVFRLDIGKRVDGHLRYGSEPMEKIPEVLNPIEQLERSTVQHLVLRQWVSQSRMNSVALDGGKEINLVFSDVNIWVDAKYPDGSDGPKCRLPIPDKVKVRIPTRVELESQ